MPSLVILFVGRISTKSTMKTNSRCDDKCIILLISAFCLAISQKANNYQSKSAVYINRFYSRNLRQQKFDYRKRQYRSADISFAMHNTLHLKRFSRYNEFPSTNEFANPPQNAENHISNHIILLKTQFEKILINIIGRLK